MKKLANIIICTFLLTGCFDKQEVEERAFVVVVGIDKGKQENGYSITFQLANPQVGTTDIAKADNEPPASIVTIEVPDIISATELANIAVARNLTYIHTRVIIISEELAKTEQFLPLIDYLIRDREMSRDVNLIVSKEKASEFINNNKPEVETRPHKLYEFMAKRWQQNGLLPVTILRLLVEEMVTDTGLYLAGYATLEKGEPNLEGGEDDYLPGEVDLESSNDMQMIGSAVIKDGKMIGTLSGEETKFAFSLFPEIRTRDFISNYDDPLESEYKVTTRVIKSDPNTYKMDLKSETPKIEVEVPFGIEILGIPSGIDYVTNKEKQKKLEKSIEDALNENVIKLIKRTQEEFKAEPFDWDNVARKEFKTVKEMKEFDWCEQYPNMEIKVTYKVKIVDFGRQLQPYDQDKIRN